MKSKTTVATIVTLAILGVGGYLIVADPLSMMGGSKKVEELTRAFVEDLQFKDFRQAGLYHHKLERDRLDIGRALESLFLVKPEMLDIRDYKIVRTEVDSKAGRAKSLVRTRYKVLNKDQEPQEKEILVYWIKRHPDCPHNGKCNAGTCVDEFGEPQKKKEEKGKKDKNEVSEALTGDAVDAKETDDAYTCDPLAEETWFMNLDSTLKKKGYN